MSSCLKNRQKNTLQKSGFRRIPFWTQGDITMSKNQNGNKKRSGIKALPLTSKNPRWLEMTSDEQEIFDTIIREILPFYVFYSPCSTYSVQGRSLQYYGWDEKPWASNKYLKNKLDNQITNLLCIKSADTFEKMEAVIAQCRLDDESFTSDFEKERIAVYMSMDSLYMSIFYHIRCAFAHGRVSLRLSGNNRMLLIENGVNSEPDFAVKARMVLNFDTLKGWADVIQNGPERKSYEKDIIALIEQNPHISIKQIANAIEDTEYMANKKLDWLKKCGVVTYINRGKKRHWSIDYMKKDIFLQSI